LSQLIAKLGEMGDSSVIIVWIQDSSVSIATGRWAGKMKNQVLMPSRAKIFLFSPKLPNCLSGPALLLSNEYPWEQSIQGVKVTFHLHSLPRSRMNGAVSPCLHDVVVN